MAFPGPSIGPWQVAELEIHVVNEVLRQIEEQVKLLRGLGPTTTDSTGKVITGTVNVGPHSHESVDQGGVLSHDDALVDVSTDDHHAVVHDHGASSPAGPLAPEVGHTEGWQSSNPIDFIQAGSGVTITESDESGAITLSASGAAALTVEEEDGTPSVANVDTIKVTNGSLTDNGGGSVSIAFTTTTADDNVDGALASQPWETILLDLQSLSGEEQAGGHAFRLRALQPVVMGDDLVGALQFLSDGSGNLIYA